MRGDEGANWGPQRAAGDLLAVLGSARSVEPGTLPGAVQARLVAVGARRRGCVSTFSPSSPSGAAAPSPSTGVEQGRSLDSGRRLVTA
jgi:hypothetical protein